MKKLKPYLIFTALLFIYSILANVLIIKTSKKYLYSSTEEIPKNKIGLLLGTGKYNSNGAVNLYYKNRVEAAVKLYNSGKVEAILVSGDNSRVGYDEPSIFKEDLICSGIPSDKIFLDFAGFRTLDSVIRAKKVFGLNSFTVISQKFHNQRAVYLANKYQIKTVAFNAEEVHNNYSLKTKVREYLAKTVATIDIIVKTEPKYLGDQIKID
ncbi:MAG: YdcF family protein [Flavobacteriaceae bacterium]|nr:YdcF family protein [Flavobacteriaceae bacterium]